MSKYGEFDVQRTERRKCKRANDPNADEDGKREYSYLKCPNCLNEDIEIASGNLKRDKHTVIRDHMSICPSFSGERPAKRSKTTTTTSHNAVMVPFNSTDSVKQSESTEMSAMKKEMAEMKQRMTESEAKHESTNNQLHTVKNVVAQHQGHWGDLARLMGYQPPKDPPFLLDKCQEKLTASSGGSTTLMLEMKDRIIEEKEKMIDSEKAHKDEFIEHYKKQLDEKNKELEKAIRGKEVAEQKAKELQHAAEESTRAAVSASSRADMLQKERDALDAKFKAVLKGNEQAARSHGKHGQSQLSKMQQGHRRTV